MLDEMGGQERKREAPVLPFWELERCGGTIFWESEMPTLTTTTTHPIALLSESPSSHKMTPLNCAMHCPIARGH